MHVRNVGIRLNTCPIFRGHLKRGGWMYNDGFLPAAGSIPERFPS